MGLEFVKHSLARGDRVFGAVRTPERAEALAALVDESDGKLSMVKLDVSDAASIQAFGEALAQATDAIDLLVNNAGINSMSGGIDESERNIKLGTLEPEGMLKMVRTNAIGPVLVTQALLPLLEASDGAKVVHVSSWLGSIAGKSSGGNYGYCTSKAALNMAARALAFDLQSRGIASVMVNPGWVQTDMGGKKAKLTPDESVGGILKVADALTVDESGAFVNHDGTSHPW